MFDRSYEASNFPTVRAGWLAGTTELPLEPELPIVDPHHHLWDVATCPYRAADLAADTAGHNVVATVYIEAKSHYWTDGRAEMRPVGETAFAAAEAESLSPGRPGFQPCAGIVGYADLALGSRVAPVLEAHVAAGAGRFRGVRSRASWHEDPRIGGPADGPPAGLLLQSAFGEGVDVLTHMDLVLDVWVYHTQLADVARLAASHPDTRIVLNHAGGPLGIGPYAGRRDEVFQVWREEIRRLGAYPNLCVKLGGLGMPRIGWGFEARPKPPDSDELVRSFGPYFEECLAAFGPRRSMFESNFPVDKGAFSYGVMWNAFKKFSASYTTDERLALFSGTAASFYGLDIGLDQPRGMT